MKEKELIEGMLKRGEPLCVTVVGLGYVGLPVAVALAKKGHKVFGVDIDSDRLERLAACRATSDGVTDEMVREVIESERLLLRHVPRDPKKAEPELVSVLPDLSEAHVFVVCVHTPLHRRTGAPNIEWIEKSCDLLEFVYQYSKKKNTLSGERLVVLESTTYPGTTKEVFVKRLRPFDQDGVFHSLFAYSPERANPGKPYRPPGSDKPMEPEDVPRVVGGADEKSLAAATCFYGEIFKHLVAVKNTDTAEFVKLTENAFRSVAIAFAIETAIIARAMGLDGREAIKAVLTKPYGLNMCEPGLLGGHCLPVDPSFLAWKARKVGADTRFIDLAEDTHRRMDKEAVELVQRLFAVRGEDLSRAHLLFFGVTYKENVADVRESGVLRLIGQMVLLGAKVTFWDPVWEKDFQTDPLRVRLAEPGVSPDTLTNIRVPTHEDDDKATYCHPIQFRGEEAEIRDKVLARDFDAVVLGVRHDVFDGMLETLVCNDVPIVDVCNGIRTWLEEQSNEQTKTDMTFGDIREYLRKPGKYSLLGTD